VKSNAEFRFFRWIQKRTDCGNDNHFYKKIVFCGENGIGADHSGGTAAQGGLDGENRFVLLGKRKNVKKDERESACNFDSQNYNVIYHMNLLESNFNGMTSNSPEVIFQNKILMTTVSAWMVTQTIKVIIGVFREKRFNFKWFIGTGGMPSSHAAGASALAASCGLRAGFDSVSFALAAVFALVTMFDAQGVRRSAGQQAGILNQMMDDFYQHHLFKPERLFELIGHTPLQVFIGGFLGVGWAMMCFRLWQS
jgi:uncharacterized protein